MRRFWMAVVIVMAAAGIASGQAAARTAESTSHVVPVLLSALQSLLLLGAGFIYAQVKDLRGQLAEHTQWANDTKAETGERLSNLEAKADESYRMRDEIINQLNQLRDFLERERRS